MCHAEMTVCYTSPLMFENPTVNLSALRNSCAKISFPFVWVDLGVCFCGQQYRKCERVNRLLYPNFLRYTSPHKQSDGVSCGDSVSSFGNHTHIRMTFFPHNDRYCHFPIYWPFLLNHPLCKTLKIYFLWDFAPTFRNRSAYIFRVKVTKKNILGSTDEDTMIRSNASSCLMWLESSSSLF